MIGLTKRTLTYLTQQLLVLRQVFVVVSLTVVKTVGHHDATAIDTLPQANGVRITLATLVEGIGTPHQFLRRETNQAAVSCQCGQRVTKAKAVGQEHIGALCIELLTVERLTQQDVTQPRFGRADNHLVGVEFYSTKACLSCTPALPIDLPFQPHWSIIQPAGIFT